MPRKTSKKAAKSAQKRRSPAKSKGNPRKPAGKRGTRWLTPAEAADRLGRSPKWLRELVKQGMPREPGRAGRYPWPAVREWHDRYLEKKLIEKLQPSNWRDERAAYTRVQRKLAELELRKREGELVEIEDARRIWSDMLDKLRPGLLNIPNTWTPELVALGATSHRKMVAKLTGLRDELMRCLRNEFPEEKHDG